MASVDRQTLVELIEAQKAKLSPEALKLWEELDASLYMSPEEEPAFIKRREVEIIDRMEHLPEADQHIVNVLSELRGGYTSQTCWSGGEVRRSCTGLSA